MKYRKTVVTLFVCFLFCNCLNADVSKIVVADQNGKHATIVIPDKPNTVEKYAARELQYHIKEASGVTLPIVNERQKPQGKGLIYLGACRQTKEAGINMDDLVPNACIVRTVDGDLFLAGNSVGRVFGSGKNTGPWHTYVIPTRVGALFAVYEFLEKQLGVKWLWPGKSGEVIPKRSKIQLGQLDETWKPHFVHTQLIDNPYRVNIFNPAVWSSPKALENYLYNQAVWLRRQRFAIGVNMELLHSFKSYWRRFGTSHPEFFNLLPDGTRRSDPTSYGGNPRNISMCVSEPALWKQIVEQWKRTRTPGDPCIKLGENDNPGKCTCPNCMAWDVPDPASGGIAMNATTEIGDDVVDLPGKNKQSLDKIPFSERLALAKKAFAKKDPNWYRFLGSLSDRYAKFYLAVQKEAEKIDPQATVLGFAYSNYVSPPLQTKLNKRVVILFVPNFIFPWTAKKRAAARKRWDGWSKTGASMMLRPNWILAGHNMPLFYAQRIGEDFNHFAAHGLLATSFDSLNGQWSTQGPNLYVLARLHNEPGRCVDEILDEYYSGFGRAGNAVRNYFRHWEKVSDAVTDKSFSDACVSTGGNSWKGFFLLADKIFTPEVMKKGRELMTEAQKAAQGNPVLERRVAFLERGLRRAELTLAAQAAFRAYKKEGDLGIFANALNELDSYRRSVDMKDTDNASYTYRFESIYGWDRSITDMIKKHKSDKMLSSSWKFMWDPENKGESKVWQKKEFDDSRWFNIGVNAFYGDQEAGKKWKAKHGKPYLGFSWYRTTFSLKPSVTPKRTFLIFGAIDEACTVWVNGIKVLTRPYPYHGDQDSWRKMFRIDISKAVSYEHPNILAVRVENNAGAGGIWKPVWLQQTDSILRLAEASDWDGKVTAAEGGKIMEVKGQQSLSSKEIFKINPDETYILSGKFKSGNSIKGKLYFGFQLFDKDKKAVNLNNILCVDGSDTKLARAVNPADKVVNIKDGSKWRPGSVVAFETDPSRSDLPNRNISSSIIKVEKKNGYYEVTLRRNIGKQYPAGTKVRAHSSGPGMYAGGWGVASDEWKTYRGTVKGQRKKGVINSHNKWWPYAGYAKIMILANWNTPKATLQFKDIALEQK